MESITALVHDDPYMRMTPQQRIAERKMRRQNFFGQRPPKPNTATLIVVPPADPIDPAIRIWIEAKKETFAQPWCHCMWFFDLIVRSQQPTHSLPKPRFARIEMIQRVLVKYYGITLAELLSHRRTQNIVRPRQKGFFLAKVLSNKSLPEIGRRFGGRDHTTVLHGIRQVEAKMASDPAFAAEVAELRALIEAGLQQ
ncbi:hypothetical protein IVB12_05375 [Bradyrhizobium sp. 179]|uniref:helix-turn-helix domain-containing protein n=1 Tax=Bradyrhizobium sp. 179 TaxID=2782648 RepID=UPI001FF9FB74|nr:helix-turn-helix domain-containing protein [Bradyrhizobium sp. 179]MCK1541422.1 hypothetical protein [Bradyrhizobium sp. 179]